MQEPKHIFSVNLLVNQLVNINLRKTVFVKIDSIESIYKHFFKL